jgi:hypothetical protein
MIREKGAEKGKVKLSESLTVQKKISLIVSPCTNRISQRKGRDEIT